MHPLLRSRCRWQWERAPARRPPIPVRYLLWDPAAQGFYEPPLDCGPSGPVGESVCPPPPTSNLGRGEAEVEKGFKDPPPSESATQIPPASSQAFQEEVLNFLKEVMRLLNLPSTTPITNPFLEGGVALAAIPDDEEKLLQSLSEVSFQETVSTIPKALKLSLARLFAAVTMCRQTLKTSSQKILTVKAADTHTWYYMFQVENQCNLWAREAFLQLTGVVLEDVHGFYELIFTAVLQQWRAMLGLQ
ncbi:uncharacterized protein LOC114815175 [Ornithorhynchus anatinus]|uniref:uncharacterized protein LOC114815175 n=1 Tax=Ornithorhynchus anatinus TaxID=9258 RepID=UPI0010A83838|nr:uncharacterized protein LOC114815175 [Ornithorhynchus anatinus]XP_028931793.1 uncharacterized protein LOC114815175 [Ornithorhynchus anatinus]